MADFIKYEVKPNDGTTSEFLYKLVEIVVYDSGHESSEDIDFFRDIHSATLACEELNQKQPK